MATITHTITVLCDNANELADVQTYLNQLGITIAKPDGYGEPWEARVDSGLAITLDREATRTSWRV